MNEGTKIGLTISLAVVFLVGLIWWLMSLMNEAYAECEDLGGHVYSRKVGKITHYKCVSDDNKVLLP